MRILVCDGLDKTGVDLLRATPGVTVDERPSLSAQDLSNIIADYDALIVRSKTKVTAELIGRATNLRVVGRAGTGVDNIEVEAATRRGVVVMNAAAGNTITTAEHTMAMLLALARQIPQAVESTKFGGWEKTKFTGVELMGKTLGIIGLGRIGSAVALRAGALGMHIVARDPYFTREALRNSEIEMVSLDDLLARADVITLHPPLTEETRCIIDARAITKMKNGVRIINCARGGLIDERALADAILDGRVAGAALDVFDQEPPSKDNPLLALDSVLVTPHLGAATEEAQRGVASVIAEQVLDYLLNERVHGGINMPTVSAELLAKIGPYISLGHKIGLFQGQVFGHELCKVEIEYLGEVAMFNDVRPITQSILGGFLGPVIEGVNMVNAAVVAEERGIKVSHSVWRHAEDFASMIRVRAVTQNRDTGVECESEVAGALFGHKRGIIVRVNGTDLEAEPAGNVLFLSNRDRPGALGRIAASIGEQGVNINQLYLGRQKNGENAQAFIQIDQPLTEEGLRQVFDLDDVVELKQVML